MDDETWRISRLGHFVHHDVEKRFYLDDAKTPDWVRPPLVLAAILCHVCCFALDRLLADRGREIIDLCYGPTLFITLTMTVAGPLLYKSNLYQGSHPAIRRCSEALRSRGALAVQDAIGCFVFWCMGVSYQIRSVYVCQGPDASLYAMCAAYATPGVPLFPVLPALHALAMTIAICYGSAHTLGIGVTVASIAIAFGVQSGLLYSLPVGGDARRVSVYDVALVGLLGCTVFGGSLAVGVRNAVQKRREFRNRNTVQQQHEQNRESLERARQAEERANAELQARLDSEQREKETRQTLVRYLFHEIRVPMNTVMMGLLLFKEDAAKLDSDSRVHLDMMISAAGTAVTTLSEALDLSKLAQSQDQPPVLKPLNIRSLVDDAVMMNTPFANSSTVALTGEVGTMSGTAGTPEWVLGDPQGLKQVLNNFVSNAIKFTPKDGTGRVKVWAGLTLPPEASAGGLVSARTAARQAKAATSSSSSRVSTLEGAALGQLGQLGPPGPSSAGAVPSGTDSNRHSSLATHMSSSTDTGTERTQSGDSHASVLLDQLTPGFVARLDEDGFEVDMATVATQDGTMPVAETSRYGDGGADATAPGQPKTQSISAASRPTMVTLYLAVCDNGVGISPEELPKLYSAFQQLDAGIQYKGRGTGLGLAITKGIIGKLQGRVGVRSAPGVGSVFYVRLSLPVVHPTHATSTTVTTAESSGTVSVATQWSTGHNVSSSTSAGSDATRAAASGHRSPGQGPDRGPVGPVRSSVSTARGPDAAPSAGLQAPASPAAATPLSDIRVMAGEEDAGGMPGGRAPAMPDGRLSSRLSAVQQNGAAPPPARTGTRAESPTSTPGSVGGRADSDDEVVEDDGRSISRPGSGTARPRQGGTDRPNTAARAPAEPTAEDGHTIIAVQAVPRGVSQYSGTGTQPAWSPGYCSSALVSHVSAMAADHGPVWPGMEDVDGLHGAAESYLPMARCQFLSPATVPPPPVPGAAAVLATSTRPADNATAEAVLTTVDARVPGGVAHLVTALAQPLDGPHPQGHTRTPAEGPRPGPHSSGLLSRSGIGTAGLLSTPSSAPRTARESVHTVSMSSGGASVAAQAALSRVPVRLLVVEDVLSNRIMLVKLLARRWKAMSMEAVHGPLTIDVAESGGPAVELVHTSMQTTARGHELDRSGTAVQGTAPASPVPYAAILMDGNMPGIDGYEATQRIRQELGYPGLILGVTGNGLLEDVDRFLAVGANEVLIKPTDPGEIVTRLAAVLSP